MSLNGKKLWFITGASPGRTLEIACNVLQCGEFALLLVPFWMSFRYFVSACKRIGRGPCWIAAASRRGAFTLSLIAMHIMAMSMVGAALLMTLAFVMRLIATALVRADDACSQSPEILFIKMGTARDVAEG